MNSESNPRSSTSRANSLMPRARSGPSPSQMYEGRNTPNRPISLTWRSSLRSTSSAVVLGRPLGEERRRALEQVVRGKDPDGRFDLGGVAGSEVSIERCVDESLDLAHGERPTFCDLLADRRCTRDGLSG